MLGKYFTKPLELKIGDVTYQYLSTSDFEFALGGRASLPAKKLRDLLKYNDKKLQQEANTIRAIEKELMTALTNYVNDPPSINTVIEQIDMRMISKDHKWRDIFTALKEGGDKLAPLKNIALYKYLQYLQSRRIAIKEIYSIKKKTTYENGNTVSDQQ